MLLGYMLAYCFFMFLWQQNKELESVIKYKQRTVESSSARSTPVHRKHYALSPAKSTENFEKSRYTHKPVSRSNTVEAYVICIFLNVLFNAHL